MALDVQISFSWTNYCRLCLLDNGIMLPLFEGEGQHRKLSHKIETCLQLVTYEGDPLPRKICHTCLSKVTQMYDFRSMVWASYERLKPKLLPLHHVPEVQKYLLKADSLQKKLDSSSHWSQCSTPIPSTSKMSGTDRLPLIRVKSEEELMQAPDCSSWPSSTLFSQLESTVTEPFLSSTSFISSSITSDSNIPAMESALPSDNQSDFVGMQPETLKRKRLSHTSDTNCDRVLSPVLKKTKGKRKQLAGPLSRKQLAGPLSRMQNQKSKSICVFCQSHFSSKQSLNTHLETCLSCSTCQQVFSSLADKAMHEAEKHVSVYIDCNQKHLSKHCSHCPAQFASSVMLTMHIKEEHSSPSIQNPDDHLDVKPPRLLETGNSSYSSYMSSEKSHFDCKDTSDSEDHPLSDFKKIGKSYHQQSSAQMNNESVVTHDNHICKLCNETLPSALDLEEHIKKIHGRFKCPHCEDSFSSKPGLNSHQKFHVYRAKKKGKLRESKSSILKDLLVSSKKPFQCDFCYEDFEEEDAFILHLYVHATEHSDDESIPVKKNRKSTGDLKKSVASNVIEESDNPVEQFSVKCERCHVVCRSKEYYKIHLATHMSKAKTNFPCSGCNQDFRNVEALNRHTCCGKLENMQVCCLDCGQALVKGADHVCDNKCPVCEKVFKSARGQRLHFTSKHKPKLLVEDGYDDQLQETNSADKEYQEEIDKLHEENELSTSPSINESSVATFSGKNSSAPHYSANESPDSHSSRNMSPDSRPCGSESPTTHISGDDLSHVSDSDADSSIGESPLRERLPPDGAALEPLSVHLEQIEKNALLSTAHSSGDEAVPFIKEPLHPSSFSSGILSNL